MDNLAPAAVSSTSGREMPTAAGIAPPAGHGQELGPLVQDLADDRIVSGDEVVLPEDAPPGGERSANPERDGSANGAVDAPTRARVARHTRCSPRRGGARRERRERGAGRGVADRQLECHFAEGERDPSPARAMPGGVGEGLLQDSVRSLVDGALEPSRLRERPRARAADTG
jgi:hypothetical protein